MVAKRTIKPASDPVAVVDTHADDEITLLINRVNQKYGANSLFRAGEVDISVKRVKTGCRDLDSILQGGVPKARMIELFGAYAAAKTSLAYQIMAHFKYCLFIDAEGTLDLDRAELFGVRPDRLMVQHPHYAEEALDIVFESARMGVPLIVIDSVPSLISKKELDETNFEAGGKVAPLAGLFSRKLPALSKICQETGTMVLFINQVRAKFGVMFGDPFDTPGGQALKHNLSLRLYLVRKQWLNHPKLGTFGQITKVTVQKSKVSKPREVAELILVFDRGWVEADQLDAVRKDLLKHPPTKLVFAEEEGTSV